MPTAEIGTVDPFPRPPAEPPRPAPAPEPEPSWPAADPTADEPVPKPQVGNAPGLADFVPADEPLEPEVLDDDAFFATLREAVRDDAPLGPRDEEDDDVFDDDDPEAAASGGSAAAADFPVALQPGWSTFSNRTDAGDPSTSSCATPASGASPCATSRRPLRAPRPRSTRSCCRAASANRSPAADRHADPVADLESRCLAQVVELAGELAREPFEPQLVVERGVERDGEPPSRASASSSCDVARTSTSSGPSVDGAAVAELDPVAAVGSSNARRTVAPSTTAVPP